LTGVSYLIGSDLAGKGLAAAGQIATITNMARYAVFRGRTLAGAVTNLNAVLVAQSLLTGFATLFIGRFDTKTQTLTYVNTGQDAGLILRAATGRVEAMPTTGPCSAYPWVPSTPKCPFPWNGVMFWYSSRTA
jgi:serine phosphatase RsbU (regulator of sigma subunit)